jgi:coenzyme Q-binding protein COQ10
LPAFRTQHRVPYSPREMFDIVADVERYPEFLPLCDALRIKSRTETAAGTDLTASMTVGYKAIRESFTTRVTLDPNAPKIVVDYVDGPFSHLRNEWKFMPAKNGSEIDFFIDYAFRSPMLGLIVGAAFDKAVRSYTTAFEARARAVYGPRTAA